MQLPSLQYPAPQTLLSSATSGFDPSAQWYCRTLLDSTSLHCNLEIFPGAEIQGNYGTSYGTPLQYSCLEKSHGLRSLVGLSPWGR